MVVVVWGGRRYYGTLLQGPAMIKYIVVDAGKNVLCFMVIACFL